MVKIFNWFVNLIFVLVIIILLGYLALRVTNKAEIYNVKTGSMEDKIHVGDYILIYRKGSYDIGDVVTFKKENGFITHRIVKKDGSNIITKGDANNTEDEGIDESSIEGKVILSGGILNAIINYKYVIVAMLLSLYLFSCYLGDGNNSVNEVNEDDNKMDKKVEDVVADLHVSETSRDNSKNKKKEDILLENNIFLEKETINDSKEDILKENDNESTNDKKLEENVSNVKEEQILNDVSKKNVNELVPIKKKSTKKSNNKKEVIDKKKNISVESKKTTNRKKSTKNTSKTKATTSKKENNKKQIVSTKKNTKGTSKKVTNTKKSTKSTGKTKSTVSKKTKK